MPWSGPRSGYEKTSPLAVGLKTWQPLSFHGNRGKSPSSLSKGQSRVEATKHKVLRLRSHIARGIDDVCFINLQLEGLSCYTQRDHEQICGPGDLAVVETTEPFEIANCRNFKLFCFAVPRYLLPGNFSERPRFFGINLGTKKPHYDMF